MNRILNALSIDVEDWFCVHNLESAIRKEDWGTCESRIVQNTERILRVLEENHTKATFFVLGWIAEKYPDLISKIDQNGHEIATHGYSHSLLTCLTPEKFENDLAKSLAILRPLMGQEIIGFRAPSFSLVRDTRWALDILPRYGILYDSSVFPVGFHPDYGVKDSPLNPYSITEQLVEFPLGCFELAGKRIPCSGGGYFRLFPYTLTRFGIRRCNRRERPVVFYLHPWELDPDQPRVKLPAVKRLRHYCNLGRTEGRLRRLLKDFEFGTIKDVLGL